MNKDRNKETLDTWNKLAGIYEEKFMDLDLYDETYEFVCNNIPVENAKLLEIGCGPGNITRYLLSKRPDFDILGIDIAPNMIAAAQKNNPGARFAIMDSRDISKLNEKYDGMIVGFCLPFLTPEESVKLIADAHALLYSNSLIYISFMEGNPEDSHYRGGSTGDKVFFNLHDLDFLVRRLEEYQFEILKIFKVPYKTESSFEVHTILTARKMEF